MKVVGLIMGTEGALPGEINEEAPSFKATPIPESIKEEIRRGIASSLPKDTEFELAEVTAEAQLLEPPQGDVYVVFPFQRIHDRWFHALYSHGKPIVIASLPLSKVFSYGNVYFPYFVRDARELDEKLGLPSRFAIARNWDELSLILQSVKASLRVRSARVVCIGEPMYEPFHSPEWGYAMVRLARERLGLTWIQMSSRTFIDLWERWQGHVDISDVKEAAATTYGLDDEALVAAKKMHALLVSILKERRADALTVNCLASEILPKLKVTPCYAFSLLNDEGIPSACEADTTTLVCMLITVYASESPGFMANPYLFPADNRLLLSHCTSPTVHELGGEEADEFVLRTHFESNLGVAPEVFKEGEQEVTITGISHDSLDEMLIIRGRTERNTFFPTCRSQVVVRVDDAKAIAENYKGRHWVMVYGDHVEVIEQTNRLLGIKSIVM